MTVREIIGQLLMVGFHGTALSSEDRDWVWESAPGGIILFAHNLVDPEQVARLTNDLQACAPTAPLLMAIDEEGGRVSRLPRGFTTFPSAGLVAAHHSPDVARDVAAVTASELRAVGINMNMAPVLDVNSHPANPIIGDRAYGDDPERVCAFGMAVMAGLRDRGVIPCGKHFPGHGDTTTDSHHVLPVVTTDRRRLNDVEIEPFRQAIRGGLPSIMTAHVRYPALDADAPATLSRPILTDLLRTELGFHGVTVTDDLEMGAILNHGSVGEAAVSAVQAGADMVLIGHRRERQREAAVAIAHALAQGALSHERLTASRDRILAIKKRYLASSPSVEIAHVARTVGHPRHAAVLEKIQHPSACL